jgi:hypothetical protein
MWVFWRRDEVREKIDEQDRNLFRKLAISG